LKVKQISASSSGHVCAIASNDEVYCWGDGNHGQLGDNNSGYYSRSTTPVAVHQGEMPSLKIKQISAGYSHACAIASNDEAYCWGHTVNGQLGNNIFGNYGVNRTTPVAVNQGEMPSLKIKQISAENSSHTCAIASNDQAYCWGSNSYGQIGDGTSSLDIDGVRSVPTLTNNLAITVDSVTIAGLPCTDLNIISNTELTCVTPAHVAGLVDISIVMFDNTVALNESYEYMSLPNLPDTGILTTILNSIHNFRLITLGAILTIIAIASAVWWKFAYKRG